MSEIEFNPRERQSKLTVKRLDKLAEVLNKDPASKLELIFGMLKMILALSYIWTRNKLIDNELQIRRQEYEQKQARTTRTELDEERFDGR